MPPPSFVYTTHAIETLVDRAIERDWGERTLLQPDVTKADPIHPDRSRAFREVPERGGRVLRVVYVVEADTYRIITVFFDRGRRRRA